MKKSIFLFFAAILCAMTANAAYNQSAKDLYFDNSEAKWNSCYVYIGHGTWTSVYPLTRVSGTQYLWKLAKADFNGGGSWNGATGWVLCYEKWWDSKGESIDKYTWHGDNNVTQKSTSAWVDTKIYKTNGTASTKSDNNTINAYKVTSYTKNNYTVTINTVEGGTLTVKDYDNNPVASGDSKIHLTVLKFSATPASGYVLEGVQINDGSTTTISASEINTKTHTLTSNVTITPVWKATTSTVTVTTSATNGTVTGAGVYEEGNSVTLTATADAGYQFKNWTVAGAEVSTANPYTFIVNADITVTANFEETPKVTIYFVNNSGWSKVQAYAWDGSKGANPSWPGADITANKLAEKIGEYDVYSYTVEQGSYGKVIFNDGSAQTQDYVWTDGNYYWNNEAKDFEGGTKADAETKFSVPVEYDYVYFINTNSWAAVKIYTWTPEIGGWPGVAMTKESEQIAGKDVYSYKAVKGTTFGGIKFSDNGGTQTGDLKWEAGKYYAPSKDKWYDTKEAAEEALAAPVVNTYTVVGSSAPLFGTAWAPELTANDMALVEGTKYELVKSDIALTAGEIEYKVAVNHAWGEAYPTDGNKKLNITEAGKYTVTFTFDSNTKAVNATAELTEAAVVLPTVGVKGAWDGWAATTTLTGDDTSAAATVNIATAGVYEFGLDVDGNFQASGATIDKANNSTVVTTNAGNMKLTANVLGEYTFTWTYETNTLTVTYPAGEEVEIAKKYYLIGTFNEWTLADANYELALVDGLYKKEVTLAKDAEFKVNPGDWGASWGKDNLGGKTYAELDYTDDGNIKMKEAKTFTIIFNPSENLITFDGLTVAAPVEKHYYLIGTFNEWTLADANYELALVDGLYKKEVTLAKDAEFKVNQGDWDASWGKDNLGGKTYAELDFTNDGNLKMKEEKTFTVIFNLAENLITFTGLTETTPAVQTITYVLMGVNGDWDNGIALTQNPGNANEYVLENQVIIKATDAVKVVTLTDGTATAWCGNVDTWSNATYTADGDGNIVLEDGIYTFYFKKNDDLIYINQTGYARNVTNTWGTICLPNASSSFTGATFYEVSSLDPAKGLWLDQLAAGTQLVAGKPYVFEATASTIKVTYTDAAVAAPVAGANGLVGTFTDIEAGGVLVGNYIIAQNAVWVANENNNLPANRAYINATLVPKKAQAVIPGRRRVCMGENATTGLDQIVAPAGQAVKVIENGQLIIIRDGVKYNVQGQKL